MFNEKEGYQGWSNYETWAFNLWLTNEQSSYEYYKELANELMTEYDDRKEVIYKLSDSMKFETEQGNPLEEASLFSDLLSYSISKINFDEVAKGFLEE